MKRALGSGLSLVAATRASGHTTVTKQPNEIACLHEEFVTKDEKL